MVVVYTEFAESWQPGGGLCWVGSAKVKLTGLPSVLEMVEGSYDKKIGLAVGPRAEQETEMRNLMAKMG